MFKQNQRSKQWLGRGTVVASSPPPVMCGMPAEFDVLVSVMSSVGARSCSLNVVQQANQCWNQRMRTAETTFEEGDARAASFSAASGRCVSDGSGHLCAEPSGTRTGDERDGRLGGQSISTSAAMVTTVEGGLCISAEVQYCDERRADSSGEGNPGVKGIVYSMEASRPFTGKYFLDAIRLVEPISDSSMRQIDTEQQHISPMTMCHGGREDGTKYGVNVDAAATSARRSAKTVGGRAVCAFCSWFTGATLTAAAIPDSMLSSEAVPDGTCTSAGENGVPSMYASFMKCIKYVWIAISTIVGVRAYDRIVAQSIQSERQIQGTLIDREINEQPVHDETRRVGSQAQCT